MESKKMKVEIWSDVTCTFCYIAKRKFETALTQFKDRDKIEVIWKSFEIAPGFITNSKKYFPEFLAELKNVTLEQSKNMIDDVSNSVKKDGLEINLHKAIPANTFNAHRFSHFSKSHHIQDKAEQSLFEAYFTRGMNIDDVSVLTQLGNEIGLDPILVKTTMESSNYTDEVRQDIYEAKEAGITGVPFFRFNSSVSLSGAQDSMVFLETLEKAFALWQTETHLTNPKMTTGKSCKIGEECKLD